MSPFSLGEANKTRASPAEAGAQAAWCPAGGHGC